MRLQPLLKRYLIGFYQLLHLHLMTLLNQVQVRKLLGIWGTWICLLNSLRIIKTQQILITEILERNIIYQRPLLFVINLRVPILSVKMLFPLRSAQFTLKKQVAPGTLALRYSVIKLGWVGLVSRSMRFVPHHILRSCICLNLEL